MGHGRSCFNFLTSDVRTTGRISTSTLCGCAADLLFLAHCITFRQDHTYYCLCKVLRRLNCETYIPIHISRQNPSYQIIWWTRQRASDLHASRHATRHQTINHISPSAQQKLAVTSKWKVLQTWEDMSLVICCDNGRTSPKPEWHHGLRNPWATSTTPNMYGGWPPRIEYTTWNKWGYFILLVRQNFAVQHRLITITSKLLILI